MKRTIEWYQAQRRVPRPREALLLQSIVLARSGGDRPAADRARRGSRRAARVQGVGRGRARAARSATTARGSLRAGQPRRADGGVRILRANGTAFPRRRFAGRASNYLTYFASAYRRELAARPAGRRRVADRSADSRPGRAARPRAAPARASCSCARTSFPKSRSLLDDFHNETVNRTLDRINRYLLREADAVVALGDRMKRRLVEEKGADPSRVHVIHNWADCEAITPGPKDNAFARAHGLCRSIRPDALGQRRPVAEPRPAHRGGGAAAVAGRGSSSPSSATARGASRCRTMAARRGLTNVRFFPYQPKELLRRVVRDGRCVSRVAQARPRRLHRAEQGVRHPGVGPAVRRGGRPELRGRGDCARASLRHGCRARASPTRWCRAIAALCDDPAGARVMGENARRAAWRYDRRVAVQAYYDLFASLGRGAARRHDQAPVRRVARRHRVCSSRCRSGA